MIFKHIHGLLPFRKLFKLVLGLVLVLQLVIITYNHFSGYHELNNLTEFFRRLTRGLIYSMIAGICIAYPDLYVIRYLNRKYPWSQAALKRVAIQFALMFLIAGSISSLITSLAHWISPYRQGLQNVLLNNLLIYAVVNAFLMSILEAWIYLNEGAKEKLRAAELQQRLVTEAAKRAKAEARIQIEEEKHKYARKLLAQQEQLNESREQLNSILLNLPGAAYRCYFDEHYTMQYISEKIFDISGYHASEFINSTSLTFASIIHPDDQEDCRKNILEATMQKAHYEIEYRIIHKKGQPVWVSENGKGIHNDRDELIFLDGIIVDINLRKEAELKARDSEKKYKDLMDLLPQPVFELNLQGEIVLSNKAGDQFFGTLPGDQDRRQSALDCFVEEDRPRIIENFKQSARGKATEPGEFTAIKKDGSLCPVMVFGNPIVRNGEIVGRRGIIIDISERKKQELNLLKAKEELERINNMLEHNVAERTKQLTQANTQLLKVQKENLQSQFEVLKQQVNPHFLFNSLNVLTSLIKIDPDLAESFTEQLSKVYRYVLENKEKDLVSLGTELDFLNSYLFLLEIRFMKKIFIRIDIEKSYFDYQILPIAIQLIIENAIKHNVFSKAQPLKIEIFVDKEQRLNIVNNLNLRETKLLSTGVGLENIKRRYALVSELEPGFIKTGEQFIARLPLLKSGKAENA